MDLYDSPRLSKVVRVANLHYSPVLVGNFPHAERGNPLSEQVSFNGVPDGGLQTAAERI